MRSLVALSLAVVTACASSGSSSSTSTSPTQGVRVVGTGTTLNTVASGPSTSSTTLPYAIDRVWRLLPAVYDSLGIPVTTADEASHTIANDGFKTRFRLGKVSLSRYLDCGNTQMGASADSYEVYLVVRTQLKPGDKSTAAETALEATARPVQFAQAPTRCSSKNALEPKVGELLGKMLAAAPTR